MARYASFDTTYECDTCEVEVARHHIELPNSGLKCPNCEGSSFVIHDKCEETAEHELVDYVGGVFIVKYCGLGTIPLPSIVIEEQQWYPGLCPVCAIPYYAIYGEDPIHFVHRIKLSDASRQFGFQPGHQMYGRDIVQHGSQVVIPYFYPSKIWIDGQLIQTPKFRNEEVGGWEYYL
jgi:hypothetical protein